MSLTFNIFSFLPSVFPFLFFASQILYPLLLDNNSVSILRPGDFSEAQYTSLEIFNISKSTYPPPSSLRFSLIWLTSLQTWFQIYRDNLREPEPNSDTFKEVSHQNQQKALLFNKTLTLQSLLVEKFWSRPSGDVTHKTQVSWERKLFYFCQLQREIILKSFQE